ncbi:MAG: hypothetical protein M3N31_09105 [Actinomycetota bacterium]|nr:hypothetical protein [Actinomycetota bacterium]
MDDQVERVMRQGLHDTTRRMLGGDDSALARVEATRHLALATARDFAHAVARARGAGLGWEEIVPAVAGFVSAYGEGAAQALFEHVAVAGSRLGSRYVAWRCDSCGGLVLDAGPYGGHPVDAEAGHAPDCGRLGAETRAYLSGLERDDDTSPAPGLRELGGVARPAPAPDFGPEGP